MGNESAAKPIVRSHQRRCRIESGRAKSITDFAEQKGSTAYVCRLVPLTRLAPGIDA